MHATLLAHRPIVVAVLLAISLAAGCGGSASPAGGPTATSASSTRGVSTSTATAATSAPTPATATPATTAATPASGTVTAAALVAIGEQVFPPTVDGTAYIECSNGGNVYASCPITGRLEQRLQQAKVTLCRCQNPAQTRSVTADITQTGGVIHVSYGSQRFDLIAVQAGGSLVVDDQRCQSGGPATSIYSDVAPC